MYIRNYISLALVLLLFGCVYPSTYYTPSPVINGDYVQRRSVTIYRDAVKLDIWVQENSDSTLVLIYNRSNHDDLQFENRKFYITAGNQKYQNAGGPIIVNENPYTERAEKYVVGIEEIIAIEFPQAVQTLDTFTFHLPRITTRSGNKVENVSKVTFRKVTKLRAITIN